MAVLPPVGGAAPGGLPQASVDSLLPQIQALSMNDAAHAQSNLAAMMWQQQYAAQAAQLMMPPPWPSPNLGQLLYVRVEGLKFEYQLTEDDVRKVFSRYGDVTQVSVDREGTAATVMFGHYSHAMAAQRDLDRKQLAGMSDAHLRVEFAPPQGLDPAFAQMAAGAAQSYAAPQLFPMSGYPTMPPLSQGPVSSAASGRPKKYTCKLEVGVENEGEFRVGSRVIQIARQIWQHPSFQESGGKTRLRGKGAGGPHEANEPLALCISCQDQAVFEEAVQYAEAQLNKVHNDYKAFCQEKGFDVPELALKVSKKGLGSDPPRTPGSDPPRGERPAGAPVDDEIEKLIEDRNEARKVANFKKSDEIRDYLKARGVVLMDEKGAKGNLKGNDVTKWRFWRP